MKKFSGAFIIIAVVALLITALSMSNKLDFLKHTQGDEQVDLPVIYTSDIDSTKSDTLAESSSILDQSDTSAENSSIIEQSSQPSGENEDNKPVTSPISVIADNIEYTFANTDFVAFKHVDPEIASKITFYVDKNGNVQEGYSVVLLDISLENLLNTNKYTMVSYLGIATKYKGIYEPFGEVCYFSNGDSTSKRYYEYTLSPNENLTCTIGFMVGDWVLSGENESCLYFNPSAEFPLKNDAQIIPITVTSKN